MTDKLGQQKDPHAVTLGRKGGLKGGKARAEKMSKEELSEAGKKAAEARWSIPRATHMGTLVFGDIVLPCAVLYDGRRVISQRGLYKGLGGGKLPARHPDADAEMPSFLGPRSLQPFIPESLEATLKEPIRYRTLAPEGKEGWAGMAYGIEAEMIPQICEVYLRARDAKKLHYRQEKVALNADLIMRGLARVGIVALIDEATGYQYARARNALAKILERFIAKELAEWVKTFNDEYYRQLFRLRGLDYAELTTKRPRYLGHITNNIVYKRLAPGVLEELKRKNPSLPSGKRRTAHHQWLTREIGHPKLREHLAVVEALMKLSDNYDDFVAKLDRVAPKQPNTSQLFLPHTAKEE